MDHSILSCFWVLYGVVSQSYGLVGPTSGVHPDLVIWGRSVQFCSHVLHVQLLFSSFCGEEFRMCCLDNP
jgi:hypothetical protein